MTAPVGNALARGDRRAVALAWCRNHAKAVLAAIGGLTPAAVLAILSASGVDVGPAWAPAIPALLALAMVWGGPANTPKT